MNEGEQSVFIIELNTILTSEVIGDLVDIPNKNYDPYNYAKINKIAIYCSHVHHQVQILYIEIL